ncbi:hypothetical protein [Flagellimonas sp.]|uniref:hypothetical protein n=1 Tax=Flagellimonas sp. TaxID=2058762 RepID=UPI003F4A045D
MCFVLFSIQISCKSQKQSAVDEQTETPSEIVLIDSDEYSNIFEWETQVIRDMKSLAKFYSKINKTRKPGLPVPTIDFSKHTALIVCAGEQKPNSKMLLSYGKKQDNQLTINIKTDSEKNSKEPQITVVTYPFYLYTIPLTDKSIEFQHVQ